MCGETAEVVEKYKEAVDYTLADFKRCVLKDGGILWKV